MKASILKDRILVPVLYTLEMYSESAVNLLLGTAAQESSLCFIRQKGFYLKSKEGAYGLFGMEMATHSSIYADYVNYRPELKERLMLLRDIRADARDELMGNPFYAAAMARLRYSWVPEPLPLADDIWGLAHYWDRHYNRNAHVGTSAEFVKNYNHYVLEK